MRCLICGGFNIVLRERSAGNFWCDDCDSYDVEDE
jgi:hypothetical protein